MSSKFAVSLRPRPRAPQVLVACLAIGLPVSGFGQIVYTVGGAVRYLDTKAEIIPLPGSESIQDVQTGETAVLGPVSASFTSAVSYPIGAVEPPVTSSAYGTQTSNFATTGITYAASVGTSVVVNQPTWEVNGLGSSGLYVQFTVDEPVHYTLSGNVTHNESGTGVDSYSTVYFAGAGLTTVDVSGPGSYSYSGTLQVGVVYSLNVYHHEIISFAEGVTGVAGAGNSTLSANLVLTAVPEIPVTPVVAGLSLLTWAVWRRRQAKA